MNQSCWIGWGRDFCWGLAEAGDDYIFANPDDWQFTASLLSQIGKHGPMLLIEPKGKTLERSDISPRSAGAEQGVKDRLNNHGYTSTIRYLCIALVVISFRSRKRKHRLIRAGGNHCKRGADFNVQR